MAKVTWIPMGRLAEFWHITDASGSIVAQSRED